MKQSINEVSIAGKLSELDLRHGKTGEQKDYIGGNIIIEVPVEGEKDIFNLVQVNVFATSMTKAGKPNPAYVGLEDLEKNAMSVAAVGKDKANDIKVNAGSISENSYYGQTGNLINGYRVNGSFFTTKGIAKAEASFKQEIVILSMADEVKDDAPTGRLLVKGGIVQYGDKLDVLNYVVESPQGVAFAQTNWNEGNTVLVAGTVRQMPIEDKKTVVSEGGFGVLEESKTKTVRELVISFGTPAKDADEAYSEEEVSAGLVARKARLEADKEKQDAKAKTSGTATAGAAKKTGGFDF
jgi:hypothetical protein